MLSDPEVDLRVCGNSAHVFHYEHSKMEYWNMESLCSVKTFYSDVCRLAEELFALAEAKETF